ncbi:MAG: hypothetical protein ACJ8MO_21890 [Bacillus sp. (in: firmicutes)]|jgi:hypothetical protein
MRFLYKRPRMEQIHEELNTVMDVMVSDIFIYLDLFLFSLIFTLLLSSVLQTLTLSIVFFFVCYSLFSGIYFFFFSQKEKKD